MLSSFNNLRFLRDKFDKFDDNAINMSSYIQFLEGKIWDAESDDVISFGIHPSTFGKNRKLSVFTDFEGKILI